MNCDHGPCPYLVNMEQITVENTNFRTAVWTGCNLQMTRMCIPPCGEIGLEIHEDTDQFIQVVRGKAVAKMGKCKNQLDLLYKEPEEMLKWKNINKGESGKGLFRALPDFLFLLILQKIYKKIERLGKNSGKTGKPLKM